MGVALGEMGMRAEEFWEMRLHDYFLKLRFFNAMRRAEREERANLVRMQTVALVNIQLARKDRIKDVRKFWRFPWEEEDEAPERELSEEEVMENNKKLMQAL